MSAALRSRNAHKMWRGEPSPGGRGQGEGSDVRRLSQSLTAVSPKGMRLAGPAAFTSPLPLSLQERGSPRLFGMGGASP